MSWQDHVDEVEEVPFSEVEYLRERAKDDETTPPGFMPPKDRETATWFHIPDAGCGSLWWPGNRSSTMRFSHCYVVPEARGEGYGKALVVYRHLYAKKHDDCERVDTIAAHSEDLFQQLGLRIEDVRGDDNDLVYLAQTFENESD